jgi:hypothetical protein
VREEVALHREVAELAEHTARGFDRRGAEVDGDDLVPGGGERPHLVPAAAPRDEHPAPRRLPREELPQRRRHAARVPRHEALAEAEIPELRLRGVELRPPAQPLGRLVARRVSL